MTQLDIDIELKRKEFQLDLQISLPESGITALLGPSGSGKSTALRVIAGLEKPQQGMIKRGQRTWFDAEKKVFLPPQQRRLGMVFQDYALFEHLTVAENVAYGLPKEARDYHVNYWLKHLHIEEYAERYPANLSGGQRQRVALARCMAIEPDLLLLDEPFSAVDLSLRQTLRYQLKELVKDVNRPVLIVSHHLEDARYLADNVGVMVEGQLLQFGKTAEVFANPVCYTVAKILGWENFLHIDEIAGTTVKGKWGSLTLDEEPHIEMRWLSIRPEHVRIAIQGQSGLTATIEEITDYGVYRSVKCILQDGTIIHMHRAWDEPLPIEGSTVSLHLPLVNIKTLPSYIQSIKAYPKEKFKNISPALSQTS
ncbi:MAG: ABC transporter ATP-binding protein [Gammaproteobacteria bacterium]